MAKTSYTHVHWKSRIFSISFVLRTNLVSIKINAGIRRPLRHSARGQAVYQEENALTSKKKSYKKKLIDNHTKQSSQFNFRQNPFQRNLLENIFTDSKRSNCQLWAPKPNMANVMAAIVVTLAVAFWIQLNKKKQKQIYTSILNEHFFSRQLDLQSWRNTIVLHRQTLC